MLDLERESAIRWLNLQSLWANIFYSVYLRLKRGFYVSNPEMTTEQIYDAHLTRLCKQWVTMNSLWPPSDNWCHNGFSIYVIGWAIFMGLCLIWIVDGEIKRDYVIKPVQCHEGQAVYGGCYLGMFHHYNSGLLFWPFCLLKVTFFISLLKSWSEVKDVWKQQGYKTQWISFRAVSRNRPICKKNL